MKAHKVLQLIIWRLPWIRRIAPKVPMSAPRASLEEKIRERRWSGVLFELPAGGVLPYVGALHINREIKERCSGEMPCTVARRPQEEFPEGVQCVRSLYLSGELASRETLQWPTRYVAGVLRYSVRPYRRSQRQDWQGTPSDADKNQGSYDMS